MITCSPRPRCWRSSSLRNVRNSFAMCRSAHWWVTSPVPTLSAAYKSSTRAFVVVGMRPDSSPPHRKAQLGSFKGLDLCLFVHAEHGTRPCSKRFRIREICGTETLSRRPTSTPENTVWGEQDRARSSNVTGLRAPLPSELLQLVPLASGQLQRLRPAHAPLVASCPQTLSSTRRRTLVALLGCCDRFFGEPEDLESNGTRRKALRRRSRCPHNDVRIAADGECRVLHSCSHGG
jgi:hypothetical protein